MAIEKLAKSEKSFIEKKIKEYISFQLKEEPRYGLNIKKLRGYNPKTWRYRIRKYRLFYLIDENTKTISLLTINHRKNAY